MTYMVVCKEKFVNLAYELVKTKSSMDDIRAVEDLAVLDIILSGMNNCFNPWVLDKRLRQEYKTIKMIENMQGNFCCSGRKIKNITEEQRIINNLKTDKAGVIADILIKHGIIKIVDELYEHI